MPEAECAPDVIAVAVDVCHPPLLLQAVDYVALGRSPLFEDYVQSTAELKRADVKSLTREEKIAFFINVYNALLIHAFVVLGPPTNTFKRLRVSPHPHIMSVLPQVLWKYSNIVYVLRISYAFVYCAHCTVLQSNKLHNWWTCVQFE